MITILTSDRMIKYALSRYLILTYFVNMNENWSTYRLAILTCDRMIKYALSRYLILTYYVRESSYHITADLLISAAVLK